LIDVAEKGDADRAANCRNSITKYGLVAKEVLADELNKRVLSETARNELRSVYDQIP
jgi:hypothetical protein